jgi:hypothetical protein
MTLIPEPSRKRGFRDLVNGAERRRGGGAAYLGEGTMTAPRDATLTRWGKAIVRGERTRRLDG